MGAVTHDLIKLIISDQQDTHVVPTEYIRRTNESLLNKFAVNEEIVVATGLRRSGKSVLLNYMRSQRQPISNYYFNLEDDRLVNFVVDDFQIVLEVFIELFGVQQTFYFDEIQNIVGWELFIRRLYNSGNKIYITGSNANLFSEELGTRLTGRYVKVQVYPISFVEYLTYKDPIIAAKSTLSTVQIGLAKKIFAEYCALGGIPAYIKYQQNDYLHTLYESIIYRDIVARYKLPNANVIKQLVFYLASNCSKEITYNSLRKLLGIGSATTVSDYCYYLENSYLCFFVSCYSDSLKAQVQLPKKIYFVDHILAKTVGFRISADFGRMLENIIFLELKRRGHEIFYYKGKKECDFIVKENISVTAAIQVAADISDLKTKQREIDGLIEALMRFDLNEGVIITVDEDYVENIQLNNNKLKITFTPAWKWLTGNQR